MVVYLRDSNAMKFTDRIKETQKQIKQHQSAVKRLMKIRDELIRACPGSTREIAKETGITHVRIWQIKNGK